MMMIMFSSVDCSGKDSLMHELGKLYNYKYYMCSRSPICNIVYDRIYKRNKEQEQENFLLIESFLKLNTCFIFVKVDPSILVKRAILRNEQHVNEFSVFEEHIKVYKQVFEECKQKFSSYAHKFLEVDNSGDLYNSACKLKVNIDDSVKMLKITDLKLKIDKQFELGFFNKVQVSNINTKEIVNFEYNLIPEEFQEYVKPPVEEEQVERDFILFRSNQMYENFLSKDLNSRQGAFVNNYDEHDNHCISYIQHYIRDEKFCMNVYVRSMNFETNFIFDNQTFNLAYYTVYNNLKKQYKDYFKISPGFIKVLIFSLHIYV